MLLIRRFEERTEEQYTRARIGGYCHLAIGEEAANVGAIEPLERRRLPVRELPRPRHGARRRLRAAPRSWPSCSARRPASRAATAARCTCSTSSAASCGGWGIVGGHLPIAVGAALALDYDEQADGVVLCQLGDGATNIGAFHEALNLAAIWNLPIVFQIINNLLRHGHVGRDGVGRARAVQARRGLPDARRARRRQRPAGRARGRRRGCCARARDERRPALLETTTYRFRGHSVADAGKVYRTPDEIAEAQTRDPIDALRRAQRSRRADRRGRVAQHPQARSTTRSTPRSARPPPTRRPIPTDLYDNVYGDPRRREQFARMARGGPVRRAGGDALMADVTYREALRRALDEELARDERVFLMGEEIGRFEGSYKVTAGPLEEVRRASACARRRSPRRASSAPASARRCSACGRSSRS